jgi:hypothetical protein
MAHIQKDDEQAQEEAPEEIRAERNSDLKQSQGVFPVLLKPTVTIAGPIVDRRLQAEPRPNRAWEVSPERRGSSCIFYKIIGFERQDEKLATHLVPFSRQRGQDDPSVVG